MRRVVALIVAFALFGVGQSTSAESPQVANREQLHQWVGCLAKKDRRVAADIVLAKPDAMTKAFNGVFFFQPSCAPKGKNMSFSGMSFFGPMAEFVLRSSALPNAKRDRGEVANEIELAAMDLLKKQGRPTNSQQYQMSYLSYLGICLHKRNPDAASLLLQTKVDSSDEKSSVKGLAVDIQQCRFSEHIYEASFDELRGAIAAARFRIAHLASRKAEDA